MDEAVSHVAAEQLPQNPIDRAHTGVVDANSDRRLEIVGDVVLGEAERVELLTRICRNRDWNSLQIFAALLSRNNNIAGGRRTLLPVPLPVRPEPMQQSRRLALGQFAWAVFFAGLSGNQHANYSSDH